MNLKVAFLFFVPLVHAQEDTIFGFVMTATTEEPLTAEEIRQIEEHVSRMQEEADDAPPGMTAVVTLTDSGFSIAQVSTMPSSDDIRGNMNDNYGDMNENYEDMNDNRGNMNDNYGDMNDNYEDMNDNRGNMNDNYGDMNEEPGFEGLQLLQFLPLVMIEGMKMTISEIFLGDVKIIDVTMRSACGSMSNLCNVGESCDMMSYTCSAPGCTIPHNITTLIDNAESSNCGLTLLAGENCVVTCASDSTATASGSLECGTSMGTISQLPACALPGVDTEAALYVLSRIQMSVIAENSGTLDTVAFKDKIKAVMADSIAATCDVAAEDVEIISHDVLPARRRLLLRRLTEEAYVDFDFRVKAADDAAQSALSTAFNSNKDTFMKDIISHVESKSVAADIPLTVSTVLVTPATTMTRYQPSPTPAPGDGSHSCGMSLVVLLCATRMLI